jgi:DNA replication and repair protein RecF
VHVARLEVVDFRNYEHALVEFGPGVTTLLGGNGQGKTNLVEAVGYLATLGSHRVPTDGPLVRRGATRAVVRGDAVHVDRRVRVEVEISPGRANRARVNGAPMPRPRDCLGVVRRVLFAPEDLGLVKGDPAGRRVFLDDLLVSLAPRFAGVRADLDRVLRQRNSLLKSAGTLRGGGVGARRAALATLAVWDEQYAALAAELVVARMSLVARLAGPVASGYCAVAPGSTPQDVSLRYVSSIPGLEADGRPDPVGQGQSPALGHPAAQGQPTGMGQSGRRAADFDGDQPGVTAGDPAAAPVGQGPQARPDTRGSSTAEVGLALLAALEAVTEDEFARGMTLVGPHRDDLVLGLHGMPLRGYASHGESWSMALALRLASYDIAAGEGLPGGPPVLILDDVFAELDVTRRDRLADLVSGAEQVLVTAAAAGDVPETLRGSVIGVAAGRVVEGPPAPASQPLARPADESGRGAGAGGQQADLSHG